MHIQDTKSNFKNKIQKFITVPLIVSSIMLGCTSIQKKEEVKIHNVKNAISFVKIDEHNKILRNAMLMTNVNGKNFHYVKEYSQITPKELKIKRKINVHDTLSFITRATQDNFIYVSDQDNGIKGYVTLYSEHINTSIYSYIKNDNISLISTKIGELMIKVYSPEVPEEVKLFYNKVVSESVISFLYSTKHLTKKESEKIVEKIWEY